MQNALTFDLEEYFHVSAYADHVGPADWNSFPSRIAESTERILQMLDDHRIHATFFVLGWLAEKKPELIGRLSAAGHEIACHSFLHRPVFEMSRTEFREDTRRAKAVIEAVTGKQVLGYRAPSFSITTESTWAFEILAEAGFRYDSSIYPVDHPCYGMPNAPRALFRIETANGPILEFPLTVLELAGFRSPIAGGAYLRALPYAYTRWGLRYLNEREERSACVYVHPWEIDPGQMRMKGRMTSYVRQRLGLRRLEKKLDRLMEDFEFCPVGELIEGPRSCQPGHFHLNPDKKE
jgi:polysaccharide deacetylase family protein (PEP-CTERM system associated)